MDKATANGSPSEDAIPSARLPGTAGAGCAEQELGAAYRATSYCVDGPAGHFTLRVGQASPEVDALTAALPVPTWAFVTAYNPDSVPAPAERNAARQHALERAVTEAGYRFCGGEGKADDGAWAPEPSLLILGVGEEEAAELARRFGQAAFLFGERGQAARLVWTNVEGERAC
jgi:Protein of unknown function (DUF3293)